MAKFLSDSDVTKLRRLIADVGTLRGQIRTLHDRTKGGERAGAHYIMLTPSGGIPAATGTPLVPGEADCLIQYREGDPKSVHDTTRPERVYNLSGSAIPGGELVIAHRDNWGDLWAEPGGGAACAELGVDVGSYRATAGATIAPGETGPIQVSGGEDCAAVVIDAVNHSECTFYLGERITAHIDKCCTAWFTGCSCCGATPSPPDCCDRSVAICIAGELKLVAVDGGSASWDVSACCDCVGATLGVTIACTPGSGSGAGEGPGPGGNTTITATWTYTCGESVTSDTIDLSSLCNDEADVEILNELLAICDGNLSDRWANFIADCDPCFEPPPCTCCFEIVPWTIAECDRSEVPGTVDDVGLTAVGVSRDPWCTGTPLLLTLTFTNNSGGDYGGGVDPISIVLSGNVPNAAATATAASDSGTISNTPLTGGFTVDWPMPGAWADGTNIIRTVTMAQASCTPGVGQLTALVFAGRGYECTISWDAVACP